MQRSFQPRLAPSFLCLLGLGLFSLAGCVSPEDAAAKKAGEALAGVVAKDGAYAEYVLGLASRTDAPWIRDYQLASLGSSNFQVSKAAIRSLGDAPPAAALEPLKQVFSAKKGLMKLLAAEGLIRLGDEEALNWLRQEIADNPGTVNPDAMLLLASNGESETVREILSSRVTNKDLSIRNEAYSVLGEIGEPWASKMLLAGLDRERGEDRQQAIVALGRAGDPANAKKIVRFVNTKGLVFASIEALGALGNPDTTKRLVDLTGHDQKLVQIYAAAALWRVGEEDRAVEILQPMLTDEDSVVRLNLAEQLFVVETPGAVDMLRQLAGDDDRDVQVAALRSLVQRGGSDLGPLFKGLMLDKSYDVASLALNGVALTGGAEMLTELEPLLENSNPYVVVSAADAILSIRARTGGAPV